MVLDNRPQVRYDVYVGDDVFTDDVLAAEASWEDFNRGGVGVWYNARPKRQRFIPGEQGELQTPDENQERQARIDALNDMRSDRAGEPQA